MLDGYSLFHILFPVADKDRFNALYKIVETKSLFGLLESAWVVCTFC